jgi:3-oxoacyl-[acyl-carrier-protein] synthase II
VAREASSVTCPCHVLTPVSSVVKTNMQRTRRVVVTGIGAVTALGKSVAELWPRLAAGQSGVRRLDGNSLCVPLGAVPDYQAIARFGEMDVCSGLALLAAEEAVTDAALSEEVIREMDVVFGTSKGGIRSLEKASRQFLVEEEAELSRSPLNDFATNAACDHIAAHFGCKGLRLNFVSACATGTHSIIMAARRIAAGKSRIVLTGSSEASLTPLMVASFDRMGVLSHAMEKPAAAMRPYDSRRDGFVIGEGSGAMIVESLQSARTRRARILAEIKAWAFGSEAYHLSAMDPSGASIASTVQRAMEMAGLSPSDLHYINSHGTATRQNDVVETGALKLALGTSACEIPISSTKPMTGHLLGATGSVEAIISILAIQNSFVPPTINLDEPDPECDLNYTPNVGLSREIENALTLNYGFGGQIGAIIFSKWCA